MDHQVRIERRPAQHVAAVRFPTTPAELGLKMASAFAEVMASLDRRDVAPAGPPLAYYQQQGDGFSVAAGFPVDRELDPDGPVITVRLPAAEVVTTTHVGRYQDLPRAYAALARQAQKQGRQTDDSGGMWEEYQSPPGTPEDRTRTVVYWPLKPS